MTQASRGSTPEQPHDTAERFQADLEYFKGASRALAREAHARTQSERGRRLPARSRVLRTTPRPHPGPDKVVLVVKGEVTPYDSALQALVADERDENVVPHFCPPLPTDGGRQSRAMTDALTFTDTLARRRSHGHVASARPASRERVTLVGFRHYKVSPSGQLTLPPRARASLGVSRGGYVDVYQTGQGVIVKRTAIDRAGRSKRSLISRPPSVRAYPDMHRYKVSGLGQLSLAAETRRAWSLHRGGVVEAACVGPVVVVLPIGQASTLLREWLGRPTMSSTSVIRISPGLYSDSPWEQWCTSRKLVAGSVLADLMCGDARAEDVRYPRTLPGPSTARLRAPQSSRSLVRTCQARWGHSHSCRQRASARPSGLHCS